MEPITVFSISQTEYQRINDRDKDVKEPFKFGDDFLFIYSGVKFQIDLFKDYPFLLGANIKKYLKPEFYNEEELRKPQLYHYSQVLEKYGVSDENKKIILIDIKNKSKQEKLALYFLIKTKKLSPKKYENCDKKYIVTVGKKPSEFKIFVKSKGVECNGENSVFFTDNEKILNFQDSNPEFKISIYDNELNPIKSKCVACVDPSKRVIFNSKAGSPSIIFNLPYNMTKKYISDITNDFELVSDDFLGNILFLDKNQAAKASLIANKIAEHFNENINIIIIPQDSNHRDKAGSIIEALYYKPSVDRFTTVIKFTNPRINSCSLRVLLKTCSIHTITKTRVGYEEYQITIYYNDKESKEEGDKQLKDIFGPEIFVK